MTDALERIAAALDRLAPPLSEPADPTQFPAYVWDGSTLRTIRAFQPLPIAMLAGIDAQRDAVVTNFARLAAGRPAHDVLLWGARGTGKSALVASAAAHTGVALVEVSTHDLESLPALFALLASVQRPFAVFIDDLGFSAPAEARTLRSLLEGGAEARPATVRLVVTSNRRHLVPRDIAEQESAINPRDTIDDTLALADRFGLSLGFHAIDQDGYLAIVQRYCEAYQLHFDPIEAVRWATQRGSRSGRIGWHYVVEIAGRAGISLRR